MIITSFKPLEVGKKYEGLSDNDGTLHLQQPCVVLREATRIEFIREAIMDRIPTANYFPMISIPGIRFYEVSLD